MSPLQWSRSLSGAPILDKQVPSMVPVLVRHWKSIDPLIDQCALDHHFIALHLGGAKRLRRRGEGCTQTRDAEFGAHSVVPAGAAFRWNTEGPVDFAHLYFAQRVVDRVVEQGFGRDPSSVHLREALGVDDPLITSLATSLMSEIQSGHPQQAFIDDLTHLLLLQLLKTSSTISGHAFEGSFQIAPFRLNRARDFIEEHLARPIGVAQIAEAAGISPFHFSRAFKRSVGMPPYAYLLDRRLARAKGLLGDSTLSLHAIAGQCGFNSPSQFARAFRRHTGVTPSHYRNSL